MELFLGSAKLNHREHPVHFQACPDCTLSSVSPSHLVESVRAADRPNFAHVVHEAEVPLSGAVHLAHSDVPKATVKFPPDIRPEPVSDPHTDLVNFVQIVLSEETEKNRMTAQNRGETHV